MFVKVFHHIFISFNYFYISLPSAVITIMEIFTFFSKSVDSTRVIISVVQSRILELFGSIFLERLPYNLIETTYFLSGKKRINCISCPLVFIDRLMR